MTLEQSICHFATLTPDKIAAVCHDQQLSYASLWQSIQLRASQLAERGAEPHRPYVYKATQDVDFIITYCALHTLKAIAVPLEHGVADEIMEEIRQEVEKHDYEDDIVDILYTTGTTGKSKGVMESKTALVACAENFIHDLHFTPDLLFIISGPLNHIASLFKLHPILTVGGTVCILDGLRDINAFFEVFNLPFTRYATFLVPASIRMLLQFAHDQLAAQAHKIDFIETGAAPITQTDMKALAEALPHSRLYNTYGGTEIGCACTYDFNDGRYMEGCIGRPMVNASVEVTSEGNVIVSGKTIMSGYVGDEATTQQILKEGKIYGSDLGYVDEEGMIHLTGRQGLVINVGGYKVNPIDVESAASSHPFVKDCICISAMHPVIGAVLKLLYVVADNETLEKRSLAQYLKTKLEPYKVPQLYEQVSQVARTYNGKLDRKAYLPSPQ